MLDKKMLISMPDKCIFATGFGLFTDVCGIEIKWVAVRGNGYFDWTIYMTKDMSWCNEEIARVGDKLHSEKYIKMLVPCDEDAFGLYRF